MLVVGSFRAELEVVGLVGSEAVGVAVDGEHDALPLSHTRLTQRAELNRFGTFL